MKKTGIQDKHQWSGMWYCV